MSAKQHVEATVLVGRTQRNPIVAEGSTKRGARLMDEG
jgi:hypothetical protein